MTYADDASAISPTAINLSVRRGPFRGLRASAHSRCVDDYVPDSVPFGFAPQKLRS